MKNITLISIIVLASVIIFSCDKNIPDGPEVTDLRELEVPTDFHWSNSLESGLTISLQNTEGIATENRILQLLDEKNRVIQVTTVKDNKAIFLSEIPSNISRLILFFPMTRTTLEVDNIGGMRNITMAVASTPTPGVKDFKDDYVMNCDEGCDRVIDSDITYLDVKKDETVCLIANLTGGLKINTGGTLRICGEASVAWTDIKSKNKTTIIVGSTGTLKSSSFFLPGSKHVLINDGTVELDNWLNVKGLVENRGEMTVKGLDVTANAELDNSGTFISTSEVDIKGTITNSGSFEISGSSKSLNIESQGTLLNECQFIVGKNVNMANGYLINNGYLRINGWFYGNTNEDVILGHESMISVANFQPDCKMLCETGFASIKVDEKTNIDSKAEFEGSIDICDENGIENNWTKEGELPENVTLCEVYISKGNCNTEGVGTPKAQDADEDGIVDAEDEFPDDPTKAFSRMEPYSGYKLWAFEDLWPSTGDYDFNDLVIATRIEFILDADFKPVEAEIEVEVRAVGASLSNGLALQFLLSNNLLEQDILESVEGDLPELDNESDNTIIVSQSIFESLSSRYNNNGQGPKKDPEKWTFKVIFDAAAVGSETLTPDFFIFRSDDRGHEVHIAGHSASAAADQTMFGSGDDATNTNTGFWYKTYNGIPWGITLLATDDDWNHPIEKISIMEAYPKFGVWATSGGSSNSDWFTDEVYAKCFHQ